MQWALWAAGTLASFLALEIAAIRSRRKGDTLSEETRAFFKVRTSHGAVAFLAVLFGFAVWFAGHILLGWA